MSGKYGLMGEDDDEQRQMSVPTPPRRRTEWYAIGCLATALLVGIVLFAVNQNESSSDNTSRSCYLSPSCPAGREPYDNATGFTNNTGWASAEVHNCCDICLPGTPPVVCFNETTCGDKTGLGDYDYLLMDHVSLQQMCRAMSIPFPYTRHDPTLTHLSTSSCDVDAEDEPYMQGLGLGIHGLWPNYMDGYPQCCGENNPLDPAHVVKHDIWPALQRRWKDPTIPKEVECEPCYMLNHEWQKHGTCLTAPTMPVAEGEDTDPVYTYFNTSLWIDTMMTSQLQTLNNFSGVVPLSSIAALFDQQVQVICDPIDQPWNATHGRFLELRTCWQIIDEVPCPLDCPMALANPFSAPCPEQVVLTTSQLMWTT